MPKVSALVPLKLHSRRLPNKNFLRLGDHPLAYHIFKTLTETAGLDEVNCYASQPQVMSLLPPGVRFLPRPVFLDGDDVKANELFRYAVERIESEIIVLCHATSPFVRPDTIGAAIQAVSSGNYDCAIAVRRLQTYCWYKQKPLNYDPTAMAQTQDLDPVFAETSGVYVFKRDDYLKNNTRVSGRPYLIELDDRESLDIDEPSDFNLAIGLLNYDPESTKFTKDRFFIDLVNSQRSHRNVDLVAFDLDGVLIDSIPVMRIAWQETMKEAGLSIEFSNYAKYIGYPFQDILQCLQIPKSLWRDVANSYNEHAICHQNKIEIYPSVHQSLRELAESGLKLAVATSKNRERTNLILRTKFPDIEFQCVTTPDDIKPGRGKPHPDQLLMCALATGADPFNAVYIGDMEVDRQSARRAGFHFVHAGWGYGTLENTEDVWFADMADFTAFILAEPATPMATR